MLRKNGCSEKTSEECVNDEPRICLFDFPDDLLENLKRKHFNCTRATFGTKIDVPNYQMGQNHFCRLNYYWPSNIHEYSIIIIDLKKDKMIQYDDSCMDNEGINGDKMYALLSAFPERVFNPRPLSAQIFSSACKKLTNKETIFIVFADEKKEVDYCRVEISNRGNNIKDREKYDNYSFLYIPVLENKSGNKVNICNEIGILSQILKKYINKFTYEVVFYHPSEYIDNKKVYDENFIPLMTNADDEIISFAKANQKSITFVFPQIEEKSSLLLELLENILPEIKPSLFPNNTQFIWTKDSDYELPNESILNHEKNVILEEYSRKLSDIENRIEQNRIEYQFLHDLLTQTGDMLVKTVEYYFNWLGFKNVINVDELQPDLKEEDLQVELDDGLLVVEVKGIGGTSTDGDCSQVSKFRHRRMEERQKFDVKALYIVNHQRYLPPKERQNPPFTEQQIKDAVNEKRGLLTTYELFKLYYLIENGIINKDIARKSIAEVGLVNFVPKAISLGIPNEIYKNGNVVIIKLTNQSIKKGDEILILKNGQYHRSLILGLQVNDTDVEEADNGEVGVRLNSAVQKNSELLLVTS
jgi:hypothetical protein